METFALSRPADGKVGTVSTGLQDKRSNALYTDSVHASVRYLAQQHSSVASTYSYRFNQVNANTTIDIGGS